MAYGGYLTGYGNDLPTSPVTSTRTTTWAVGGRPQSTRGAVWATLATVTSTRAAVWSDLVPVASTRSTTWATWAAARGAVVQPTIRLRVFAPNGADLGVLPTPVGPRASTVL